MKRTVTVALIAVLALAVVEFGISVACNGSKKSNGQGETRTPKATPSGFQMTLATDPQELQDGKEFVARVHVTDAAGKTVDDAQVRGSLVMTMMDMGKNEFEFASKGNGDYEAKATPTMAGPWEVRISAKRGGDAGEKSFPVNVKE